MCWPDRKGCRRLSYRAFLAKKHMRAMLNVLTCIWLRLKAVQFCSLLGNVTSKRLAVKPTTYNKRIASRVIGVVHSVS